MKYLSLLLANSLLVTSTVPAIAAPVQARATVAGKSARTPDFLKSVVTTYSNFSAFDDAVRTFSTSATDINYLNNNFGDLKGKKLPTPSLESGTFVFRDKGAVNRVLLSAKTPGVIMVNGKAWKLNPQASAEANLQALSKLLHPATTSSLYDLIVPSAEAVSVGAVVTGINRTLFGIWALGWAGIVVGLYAGSQDKDQGAFMAMVGLAFGWAWPLGMLISIREGHGAEMPLVYPVNAACQPKIMVEARSAKGDKQVLTLDQSSKPMQLHVVVDSQGKKTEHDYSLNNEFQTEEYTDIPFGQILRPFVENCAKGEAGRKKMDEVFATNKQRLSSAASPNSESGASTDETEINKAAD